MMQNAADLGLAGETKDTGHQAHQIAGIVDPAAGFALVKAAIIDELDVEAAKRCSFQKHLALHLAGLVPARLA